MRPEPTPMNGASLRWFTTKIEYIAQPSPAGAQKVLNRSNEVLQLFAESPKLARRGTLPGTKRFVVSPYILTLREIDGVLVVVAMRHAQQHDAYASRELRPKGSRK